MEFFKKYMAIPYKILKVHFTIHFISYAFCVLNYIYLLSYEKRLFFISFITIQTLLLLFILQLLCLMKSSFSSSIEHIKYATNIYMFLSLIFIGFVIVQYVLIFRVFNTFNIYKICLFCPSILYYLLDIFIFIYEYCLIKEKVKKCISDRILMQLSQSTNTDKNNKTETQPSERNNKDIPFQKEDTVYIISSSFDDKKNNSKNKKGNKKNNQIFTVISNNKIDKIMSNKNLNINNNFEKDFENFSDSNRNINLNEENKSNKTRNCDKNKIFISTRIFKTSA